MYDARNSPDEDDPMERYEEMNRMREHVFGEIDQNKDFMITMDEFLSYTGKQGEKDKFKEDEGWEVRTDGAAPEGHVGVWGCGWVSQWVSGYACADVGVWVCICVGVHVSMHMMCVCVCVCVYIHVCLVECMMCIYLYALLCA